MSSNLQTPPGAIPGVPDSPDRGRIGSRMDPNWVQEGEWGIKNDPPRSQLGPNLVLWTPKGLGFRI